jgi:NAD(P)-dependent dehydrogenase (short-subunit alcohol dehydrogenase family)
MSDSKFVDGRDVTGRVVIITGAGQGIGRAYALAFARAGAIPIIAEINPKTARNVEQEIRAEGGDAMVVEVDVADAGSTNRMAEAVLARYGRIDVLVNNAGIFSTIKMRPFDEIPLDEWEQVLRVNTTGPFLCARAVVPAMRAAKWGRIINISTSSIRAGVPNYLHYTASKAALNGMTFAMARELGKQGITVNAVIPGGTITEVPRESLTQQGIDRVVGAQCIPRPETPEDIVGLVMFLASPASAFVTGQTLAVNGGLTHS